MPRAYRHVHPQIEYATDVELSAVPGSHYRDAFAEAIHMASRMERGIRLTFNGVVFRITPTSTIETLVEELCAKYQALSSTQVST